MYIPICASLSLYIYTYVCIHARVFYMCLDTYLSEINEIHIHVYIHTYIYTHIHVHTCASSVPVHGVDSRSQSVEG